jgi:hypothetical protein
MHISPFCAIRSADILSTLNAHLQVEEVRTAQAIIGLMLYAQPAHPRKPNALLHFASRVRSRALRSLPFGKRGNLSLGRQYLEELLLVDEILSDAGVFPPFNAFATYRKRA